MEESRIFVGNLPFSMNDSALADLFRAIGRVDSASIVYDRGSGRSRGFGFVEMNCPKAADEAVRRFNGHELQGRHLKVTHAKKQIALPAYI